VQRLRTTSGLAQVLARPEKGVTAIAAGVVAGATADLALGDVAADVVFRSVGIERLMFGRGGPPLSRAISSRWAATVRRSSATSANSVSTKSFSSAGDKPLTPAGGDMATRPAAMIRTL
jgi:hypothetical protein